MTAAEAKPTPTIFPERAEPFDLSSFPCPRCATVISADSYGPCPDCVGELQANQRREKSTATARAYEPKMNVTPNAVALKDD